MRTPGKVFVVRVAVLLVIVLLMVGPSSYLLLNSASELLRDFPTSRILSMFVIVVLMTAALVELIPTLRSIINRQLFPGSFDYRQHLLALTNSIVLSLPLEQVVPYTLSELTRITGANVSIASANNTKQRGAMLVASSDGKLALEFGAKKNGDPWLNWDYVQLNRLISQVAVLFNLSLSRKREEERLIQLRLQLAKSTQELRLLNDRLIRRDKNNALAFDQLAHDLKNPIVIMSFAFQEIHATSSNVQRAKSEVSWMKHFSDHVLELSRMEAGRVMTDKKAVNLIFVIEDALEELFIAEPNQHKKITWESLVDQHEARMRGDANLLEKMFTLVLLRVLEFSTVIAKVKLRNNETKKCLDTEIAIETADDQFVAPNRKTLEGWKQKKPDHSDRQAGITGLELRIADWISTAHGGNLQFEVIDARRALLRISLPAEEEAT